MGLFQHKQPKNDASDDTADERRFFDATFQEELRNHGRWYFEKIINENAEIFKQQLDATVAEIGSQLKERVSKQLDDQLTEYGKTMKEAQDAALQALNTSARALQERQEQIAEGFESNIKAQEEQLSTAMKEAQDAALQSLKASADALQQQQQQLDDVLQKNIAAQEAALSQELDENRARIAAVKDAQDAALQVLKASAEDLQAQQQQFGALVQKNVAAEQALLVQVFEENMSQIIEYYLLNALGEQYDLKAQLPAIIAQMNANKQAIVDDMKL